MKTFYYWDVWSIIIILNGFLFIKFSKKCDYVNMYVFIEYKDLFICSTMSSTGSY